MTDLPIRTKVKWKVRKDPNFGGPGYPCVWFVIAPEWEQLNQNHDVACIEGGSHATWAEAMRAAQQGCALDRATNGGWTYPEDFA